MTPQESAIIEINRRLARLEEAIFVKNGAGQTRHIMAVVARDYGFTISALTSRARHEPLVTCRLVALYLARTLTEESSLDIGADFHRDHSNVLYAQQSIGERIQVDARLAARVARLREKLSSAGVPPASCGGVSPRTRTTEGRTGTVLEPAGGTPALRL